MTINTLRKAVYDDAYSTPFDADSFGSPAFFAKREKNRARFQADCVKVFQISDASYAEIMKTLPKTNSFEMAYNAILNHFKL